MRFSPKALTVVLLCSGIVVQLCAQVQTHPAAFTYCSDFDLRARDGWESYPLAQDAGYDPTLNPGKDAKTAVLTREVQPLRDGDLSLGIVHRFHFMAQGGAKISFRYRSLYSSKKIKARVTVFRGANSEQIERNSAEGPWQFVELSLPANGNPVTGLAIEVLLSGVATGRLEKVEFADVAISASAPSILDLHTDKVLWDSARELYYLRKSILQGQEFTQQLTPSTRWEITSPDSTVKKSGHGAATYKTLEKDPVGIWTLRAWGDAGEARLLFLVKGVRDKGLLFDSPSPITPELLSLVRRRRHELEKTVHAELGASIAKFDERWLLPGLPSYFALLVPPSELALLDAVEFKASGDQHALEESRAILGSMAAWPTWLHPWFQANGYGSYYPVGLAAANIVMAKEYLGEALKKEDRAAIDDALLRQVIRPTYTEYVDQDRISFNTSNWIGNTVGGALLAAASLHDENSAGYLLGLYRKEYEHVRASYMPDGSYGEGVSYERFDLGMSTLVAALAKRHLGTSLDDLLLGCEQNLLYAAYSKEDVIDYGDTHPSLGPSNVFAYLASLNRSPALTRYYFANRDSGAQDLLARLLWEHEIHAVTALDNAPESKVFSWRGIAILRDGWSEAPDVAVMHAGANFNHNHADQGSVVVASDGDLWLGEAGYADYYKDPSYQNYVTQAAGHNTLLVDGNWLSQQLPGNQDIGIYPRIERSYLGNWADVVSADLRSVYGNRLRRYRRTLVSLKHGPVFVVDTVESAEPHSYSVLWHPIQEITSEDRQESIFAMKRELASKAVRVFGSDELKMGRLQAPLPLAGYSQAEVKHIDRPVVMQFSTSAPRKNAVLVTAIGEPDAIRKAQWRQYGESHLLSVGSATMELSGDGFAVYSNHGDLALFHITSYSHAGIAIHATAAVSGELLWKSSGQGELVLDAEKSCGLTLGGLEESSSLSGSQLHLERGRNVFSVHRLL